jgi:hypothetical protein
MIANCYSDLNSLKQYMMQNGQPLSVDANDDVLLESLIETASRFIDDDTHRTFYGRTETHLYDLPDGSTLRIDDDDLLSVTVGGLLNGDGTVITAAQFTLYPLNTFPKHEIHMKQSSNVYWEYTATGDSEAAISVAGTWGYSAVAPRDIATLTMALAHNLYKSRFGEGVVGAARITAAGVVITPGDIPQWGERILERYRRLV